jgi:hypothetical protein
MYYSGTMAYMSSSISDKSLLHLKTLSGLAIGAPVWFAYTLASALWNPNASSYHDIALLRAVAWGATSIGSLIITCNALLNLRWEVNEIAIIKPFPPLKLAAFRGTIQRLMAIVLFTPLVEFSLGMSPHFLKRFGKFEALAAIGVSAAIFILGIFLLSRELDQLRADLILDR